ncbi:MAG: zinc transporter ZupT [Clostridium sp.]|uniref:zinc transporter ZupT n=1 Tax=Clostridium sp. TaxID=1506 RepID=UPI0025BE54F0|nr:zinc transporter ZupT [Clostridium sp.]MCF0148191.1 zinc transporter ZupT [Clostridium sp.]
MDNVIVAFLITLFAGLATGIGSLIAFLAKSTNKKFLSISLGFSAGVMIYVSMVEIFVKAKDSLVLARGEKLGSWLTVISFFLGMLLIAIIDKFVPSKENPHEVRSIPTEESNEEKNRLGLLRTGVFTAIAIAIHNFPEGLATFVSALTDMKIAIPIAIAIAIHNIPEGISVSVPIYFATGDKKKAFLYSFLSGMAEPLGAIVGYVLLKNFFNDLSFGIIFAMVAGIMVFISLDELLPAAKEYGEHHLSIYGLILGMIVMAVSLLLFI